MGPDARRSRAKAYRVICRACATKQVGPRRPNPAGAGVCGPWLRSRLLHRMSNTIPSTVHSRNRRCPRSVPRGFPAAPLEKDWLTSELAGYRLHAITQPCPQRRLRREDRFLAAWTGRYQPHLGAHFLLDEARHSRARPEEDPLTSRAADGFLLPTFHRLVDRLDPIEDPECRLETQRMNLSTESCSRYKPRSPAAQSRTVQLGQRNRTHPIHPLGVTRNLRGRASRSVEAALWWCRTRVRAL